MFRDVISRALCTTAAAILVALGQANANAQVKVWEGTITLPSSVEGDPDENPPFDLFATRSFNYSYTLRQNIRNERPPKTWRAIYLENEYLKCSVLPDLGGHVYTCVDKVSGEPMFYANPSIKEQLVSYRGAWAAFGVEFNFPVSHNWVSVSPVDFSYSTHGDGSASVTVGNIDRVYGMEWTVELVLRPGVSRLETHATLANRDGVRHRFYWWTNAGVQVWDDSRLYYPMQFSAAHGFKDVDTWPVNSKGMDLSVIANHTAGPVSRFVYASREPFMGIYHPHTNTGVVHYSDYAELPGKKIWTWGVDPDGLQWRKALSDNNSAYAEVQAGLYRNQETFAFLEPQQVIRFQEYWMPVRKIGGITRANPHGVLFLKRSDGSGGTITLHAGFNANERLQGATVSILDGTKVISTETADVSPATSWAKDFTALPAGDKYTFRLQDANGAVLLEHTEHKWDWWPRDQVHVGTQPEYRPRPEAEWGDGDFIEAGRDQEQNGAVLKAWQTYENGLRRYPSSYVLLKAAGRLAVGLLRYEEAEAMLTRACERDTTDAEVHYYLGLAREGLGQDYRARGEFETATRMPEWRAAGSLKLAELLEREGDKKEAGRWIKAAELSSPDDERVAEVNAVVLRLGGTPDAPAIAAAALTRFPTSTLLRIECGRGRSENQALWLHLAADPARVLHAATEYMSLGDYRDALLLLSRDYPIVPAGQAEPGTALPQQNPLVAYYRGYCKEKLGEPSAADYKKAAELSVRYIFPNRAESEPVLRSALKADENDANAHWLLGALLFSRGQSERAVSEWQTARRLKPGIPALDASLGRELLAQGSAQEAAQVLEEGTRVDATNPEVYSTLDDALSRLGGSAKERAAMLQRYPDAAAMPSKLVLLLARNLADAGEFQAATALFRNRYFERAEQGTDVRRIYLEVKLKQAQEFARKGDCRGALATEQDALKPVADIPFTSQNLAVIVDKTPSLQALRTEIQGTCSSTAAKP
jgi:Flp pilus assembly protein TadD